MELNRYMVIRVLPDLSVSAKSQSLEGFAIPDRSCFDQLRNDKVRSW